MNLSPRSHDLGVLCTLAAIVAIWSWVILAVGVFLSLRQPEGLFVPTFDQMLTVLTVGATSTLLVVGLERQMAPQPGRATRRIPPTSDKGARQ